MFADEIELWEDCSLYINDRGWNEASGDVIYGWHEDGVPWKCVKQCVIHNMICQIEIRCFQWMEQGARQLIVGTRES
jgi:hypothetical protein